jgi:Fe-S-cluster containining protein
MWVIARGLRLAPEQFLAVVRQREPSSRGFALDRSDTRYDIALDKAAGEAEERPCIFWLGLPSGAGRCGIYALRPLVCQTYPAILHGGAVIRREDVLCATDAWRDGTLRQPVWGERLQRMYAEFEIYEHGVARWNTHVAAEGEQATPRAYFAFLMAYYSRLEAARAALSSQEWAEMCAQWQLCRSRGLRPLDEMLAPMAAWQPVLHAIGAAAEAALRPRRLAA